MSFERSDEQRMLTDMMAAALGRDGADWDAVVPGNGLDLLGVPEDQGRLGTAVRDAAVVAEAIGRANGGLPWAEHWVARRLGAGDAATEAFGEDALTVLHAAEIVGLCATMLHDATAYARERRQFGMAIAGFQVLRHRMADMAMMLEQARAIVDAAIDAMDDPDAEARARTVSAAKVVADDAARIVGEGAVQIHGAMGLTQELRVGGYFRRARALMQTDGGSRRHLAGTRRHHFSGTGRIGSHPTTTRAIRSRWISFDPA
ncbi:acyl-CoA dehydrogenase family protein [Sphingomonas sp. MMS24-JH45]